MKILADTLRQGMTDRVATRFNVAEAPGPGVIYLHWAITDLYLQKMPVCPTLSRRIAAP